MLRIVDLRLVAGSGEGGALLDVAGEAVIQDSDLSGAHMSVAPTGDVRLERVEMQAGLLTLSGKLSLLQSALRGLRVPSDIEAKHVIPAQVSFVSFLVHLRFLLRRLHLLYGKHCGSDESTSKFSAWEICMEKERARNGSIE